eukprot:gene2881-3065_t
MNRLELQEAVYPRISQKIMEDILSFVQEREPNLWGEKTEKRISDLCYIYFYKMIVSHGYSKLEQELCLEPDKRLCHRTIEHNLNKLHNIIYDWARSKILLGSPEEWDNACSQFKLKNIGMAGGNLWIDSCDFPMMKSDETEGWTSSKLHGRAIKVHFVVDATKRVLDATKRVRFIAGPVNPGQYNSDFHKDLIIEKFKGGRIVGDIRYLSGIELFKGENGGPEFICYDDELLPVGLKKRKRESLLNNHITGLFDEIFEDMKNTLLVIAGRHLSNIDRLYETITIATAVYNCSLEDSSSK